MASLGHIAVGLAAARAGSRGRVSALAAVGAASFWSALSLLPDADVIGLKLGIPYHAPWGHRGATHSFVFCIGVALLIALAARALRLPARRTFVVAAVVLISHPLLDVLTDGGLGCALLWPFDDTRYFAPWTPIPVAPIGKRFFTDRGLRVALIELLMFSPVLAYAIWPRTRG